MAQLQRSGRADGGRRSSRWLALPILCLAMVAASCSSSDSGPDRTTATEVDPTTSVPETTTSTAPSTTEREDPEE